ncbi:DC-STAMP domain-containing protein 2 [Phaenicophaeus curvirostris]|uniref:DC-STAMP domain-containing protein 2 n=1 Tax=Phaenicophaeus curvirostris TaxID=33595 RepID=UPI0037F0D47A
MGQTSGLGRALRGLKSRWKVSRRPKTEHHSETESRLWELARSAGGLVFGMVLASLYGALVLLAQGSNIWYCLVTTSSLGAGLGLGMAFSIKARITVLLSLPYVFTKEGKMLMLLLALGMALQGPCSNILHNFSRAAESLSCGAELALNQTAEKLQRAREPLMDMLAKIKDIAQKAKVVGDHIRKFFRSITDSVTYIARALRNVWLWLVNIGEICNRELGKPYERCVRLFDDAKDSCERTIPFLYFLCYVIVPFKYLCGLAKLGTLFCIIPYYIQEFLKKNVADPLVNALERVRQEFEFNISAKHHFSISLNSSKTLGEVALDIMDDVSRRMRPVHKVLGLFTHVSFWIILYMYFQALRYHHRYLRDDTFDNIYITRRFIELEQKLTEQGKATVLPLSNWEKGRYISPAGLLLSRQEQHRYGLQLIGVLRHMLLGFSIILADYSLFWLLDLIRHQLKGEIVARAPLVMGISVQGEGYTSEIFRDLVSAFDVLQQGNLTVLTQSCIPKPVEPDYGTYISMGLLYGTSLFIAVFGSYMARLRRVVCAAYYPMREQERTVFLHNTILARRAGLARALRQAAMGHTGGAAQINVLLKVPARRLPLFMRLVQLLCTQKRRCLTCEVAEQPDFIACITPRCKGLYCSDCYRTLHNVCSVCMGPLAYEANEDEEMDSSDEETLSLWVDAVRTLRGQEQGRRLRQRIRQVARGQGGNRRLPRELAARLLARLKEEASGESEEESSTGDSEDSSFCSLDYSYQDEPESSGTELEEVITEKPPSSERRAQ